MSDEYILFKPTMFIGGGTRFRPYFSLFSDRNNRKRHVVWPFNNATFIILHIKVLYTILTGKRSASLFFLNQILLDFSQLRGKCVVKKKKKIK